MCKLGRHCVGGIKALYVSAIYRKIMEVVVHAIFISPQHEW